MNYRTLAAALLLVMALAGCAKNGGATVHRNPAEFEAIKDPPINANTHFAAGQLAESRHDDGAAISQYQRALQDQPNHPQSLYRLGYLYAKVKKYPEAMDIWKRYVKATDGSAAAYSNLAFCEEMAGNPKDAEADYLRGIKRDATNEACRVNYGLMLARHGRMNEAVLQLQAVLAPAEVHYDRAGIYASQGRKELAKAEYQRAVELDPNFGDAKTKLAQLN
jgi:tetratricopeptide (TPR) repeat protein